MNDHMQNIQSCRIVLDVLSNPRPIGRSRNGIDTTTTTTHGSGGIIQFLFVIRTVVVVVVVWLDSGSQLQPYGRCSCCGRCVFHDDDDDDDSDKSKEEDADNTLVVVVVVVVIP